MTDFLRFSRTVATHSSSRSICCVTITFAHLQGSTYVFESKITCMVRWQLKLVLQQSTHIPAVERHASLSYIYATSMSTNSAQAADTKEFSLDQAALDSPRHSPPLVTLLWPQQPQYSQHHSYASLPASHHPFQCPAVAVTFKCRVLHCGLFLGRFRP